MRSSDWSSDVCSTDRHGLKDLCRELLGVDLSKQQQSSDWGAAELSPEQLAYAASDVLHLHDLRAKLDVMLAREGREGLARACFEFLPARAALRSEEHTSELQSLMRISYAVF